MRERLNGVASRGGAYHKKWLMINVAALPLTFALSPLPGPNVFLCARAAQRERGSSDEWCLFHRFCV